MSMFLCVFTLCSRLIAFLFNLATNNLMWSLDILHDFFYSSITILKDSYDILEDLKNYFRIDLF